MKKLNENKKSDSDDEDEDEDDKMRVSSARKAPKPEPKDEEAMEEADEDEEEEKEFAHCKPVTGIIDESEVSAAMSLKNMNRSVFYANDAIYHMFRLHSHLYERLATARESATTIAKAQKPARKQAAVHSEFLNLLFHLLNGATTAGKFEDDCRTLLGAKSYLLFTLDKLIYKVIKQVQLVIQEEPSGKLLHLHDYELARDAAFNEGIYAQTHAFFYKKSHVTAWRLLKTVSRCTLDSSRWGPNDRNSPTVRWTRDSRLTYRASSGTVAGGDIRNQWNWMMMKSVPLSS